MRMERMTETPGPAGFKEWAFVCEALGRGVQTLILRKGGIHEGRGGFHFQHQVFWLFPTGFHAQEGQLRWIPEDADAVAVPQDDQRETVSLRYFARLDAVWRLTDWARVEALEPFHIWRREVVRDRFAWNEESCLHAALVRVSALREPWVIPYERGFGGCRSWVTLPEAGIGLENRCTPVMEDTAWRQVAGRIRALLD